MQIINDLFFGSDVWELMVVIDCYCVFVFDKGFDIFEFLFEQKEGFICIEIMKEFGCNVSEIYWMFECFVVCCYVMCLIGGDCYMFSFKLFVFVYWYLLMNWLIVEVLLLMQCFVDVVE